MQRLPADDAAAAFGRAAIAGRLAEARGAAALLTGELGLLAEAEAAAMRSRALDPTFRDGAATRMLGTLWVLAPADLLEAGDSEEGLSLLERLVAERPDVPDNHLRLAEALVALDDDEAAHAPLCRAGAARARLRRDHQALLDRLVAEVGPLSCPAHGAP